jgi:hypothetical protein
MKTGAPPVATFGMSLAAACPTSVAMLLCSCAANLHTSWQDEANRAA